MTNKVRYIHINVTWPVFFIIHTNGGTEQSTYVEAGNKQKKSQPGGLANMCFRLYAGCNIEARLIVIYKWNLYSLRMYVHCAFIYWRHYFINI